MMESEDVDAVRRPVPDGHVRLRSRRRSPESRPSSRRFIEIDERNRGIDHGAFSGRPTAKEPPESRPSVGCVGSQDRRDRNDSDYRSHSRREEDDERWRRPRGRDDPDLPSQSVQDERRDRGRRPRDRDTLYRSEYRYRNWDGKSGGTAEEGEFRRPRLKAYERELRGDEMRSEVRRSKSGIVPWMDEPEVDRRVPSRGEWGGKGDGSSDGFGGKWGHDMFDEVNRSPEKKVEEVSIERIEALLAA